MDGQRFDAIMRALASVKTRRHAIGLLLGAAGAAFGSLAPRRAGADPGAYCGVTCADSGQNCDGATDGCYTCCDPLCVDTTTDPANCGNCGVVCPGGQYAVCGDGVCSIACPDGQTACGDGSYCADLGNDPQNCLSCGFVCPDGQTCCGALGCIDLTIDLHNCGACGTDCGIGGQCCASTCVDPSADAANCGVCGVNCPAGQKCQAAACVDLCPAGQLFCDPDCVDPQNDPSNCGACGTVCAGQEKCHTGACVSTCPDGASDCGTYCADLTSDQSNCGACGTACTATQTCQSSVCVSNCSAGTTDCGTYCANLTSDQANCGACGTACTTETTCLNGHCIRPECPKGQTKCNNGCFDMSTDPAHCGGCHNFCLSGLTCCGGACFDLGNDPNHCGRCDFACPPGYTCDGKACTLTRSGVGTVSAKFTASPDFCATKGRNQAAIDALFSSIVIVTPPPPQYPTPTPVAISSAARKGSKTKAKPVSAAGIQAIFDTVTQVSACGSANDATRQTALMTDGFAIDWLLERGFTADSLAATAHSTPLPPQSWEALSSIDQVFNLGENRVSARVTYAPLGAALAPRIETRSFTKSGEQWLLDAVQPEGGVTISGGSLIARIFACPPGQSAYSQTTPCPVASELLFDYEILSADGKVRKSAADATFLDAGLLLWDNLPPGAFHVNVTAPAGVNLVKVTPGAAVTPGGELIVVVPPGKSPAVFDVYHQRDLVTDVVLQRDFDTGCPPCSRKDALRGICIPACPLCANCRTVEIGAGRSVSNCVSACAENQVCESNGKAGGSCCAPSGSACSAASDCCSPDACVDGFCGCAPAGASCASASCCQGTTCRGSKHVCTACAPLAAACSKDSDCCDGACFDGTCRCCAPVPDSYAKTHLCCAYPQMVLSVSTSSLGPAFKRCCTPGVDCAGDPDGPGLGLSAVHQGTTRVCGI